MEESPKYCFNKSDAIKVLINIAKYVAPLAILLLEQYSTNWKFDFAVAKVMLISTLLDLLHRFTKWSTYLPQKIVQNEVENTSFLNDNDSELW